VKKFNDKLIIRLCAREREREFARSVNACYYIRSLAISFSFSLSSLEREKKRKITTEAS
jgi:hypothetical protein